MSLLATMSLAGSIPVVLYYILKTACRKLAPNIWYKRLLWLSMFFFLIPFQNLKYTLSIEFPAFMYPGSREKVFLKRDGWIGVINEEGYYNLVPVWKIVTVVSWIFLVGGLVIFQLVKYIRLKRTVKMTSRPADQSIWKMPSEKAIQRKAKCLQNDRIETPFTMGIWYPWIVLPDREFSDQERRMILLHESAHIKNRDILFKFICLGICLLHWFNPFAWLLLYEYGTLSEMLCDEEVVSTLGTMEERKIYAALLVKTAVREKKIPVVFADYFTYERKEKRRMKNRIEKILHSSKKTGKKFLLTVLVAFLLSSATVVAYDVPEAISEEVYENAVEGQYYIFSEEKNDEIGNLDFSKSNSIFIVGSTGEQINLEEHADKAMRIICSHNYVNGYKYEHISNGTGRCVLITYEAKRCTKCGLLIQGEAISKTTYKVCPHN